MNETPAKLGSLGTISLIARNELADSVRSRRVMVLLLLYVLGAIAATVLFTGILHGMEKGFVHVTAGNPGDAAGTGQLTTALWKSDEFRRMLTWFAGDKALADTLLAIPPLAVFYGWLSFVFTPVLVMLTSSTRVAEEISTGSVRFVMFRAARRRWCLGKFIGQALQVFVALLCSALAAWITGWLRMNSFEPGPTAVYMLWFAVKAWLYAMPFLGLAFGVSQLFSSPNLALAFGFIAMVFLSVLASLSSWLSHLASTDIWRGFWKFLNVLTPGGHRQALWWNDPAHLAPAAAILLVLGAAYLLAGYARFSRRDL